MNAGAVVTIGEVNGEESIIVNNKNVANPMLPYDYVVYKDAGVTYALNCTTGYVDFSGTDNEVMNAVTSGGHVYVYVKRGVTWTTTSIPAWTFIEGIDGSQVLIRATTPSSQLIELGSHVRLKEVSLWDNTGDQGNTVRYINEYVNLQPTHSYYSGYNGTFLIDTGEKGKDTPAISVNMYEGYGDNFWAGVGDSAGYRAHVSQLNHSKTGYGFHVQNFGAGYGFYGIQKDTATAPLIELTSEDVDTPLIDVTTSAAHTGKLIDINSNTKKSGDYIGMFSGASGNSNQTGLFMNFGYGTGDYTGKYINLQEDGVSKFFVEDDGTVYCEGITFDDDGDYLAFDRVNSKFIFAIGGDQVAIVNETGFHNL
jgi:hypothetical protein